MRRFVKRLKGDERGLTLIEMIAALSISSTVLIVLYGVVQFGFNSYHKITIENSLRDDGDLIMSAIIAEMYEVGPTVVGKVGDELLLEREGLQHRIDISGGSLVISDNTGVKEIDTTSDILEDGIKVVCAANAPSCGSGKIEIKLKLAQTYGGRQQTMELESMFGF